MIQYYDSRGAQLGWFRHEDSLLPPLGRRKIQCVSNIDGVALLAASQLYFQDINSKLPHSRRIDPFQDMYTDPRTPKCWRNELCNLCRR